MSKQNVSDREIPSKLTENDTWNRRSRGSILRLVISSYLLQIWIPLTC